MKHNVRLFSVLAFILLASCGKDPALARKSDQQQIEIARLSGELALVEEKIQNIPQDRSAELTEALKIAEEQNAEIERLDTEVAKLQARKAELKKEFEEYRRKYAIR